MSKQDASVDSNKLLTIPTSLIKSELEGLYGSSVLQDMYEIIEHYQVYDKGASFNMDSVSDYTPADLRYRSASALLDKEVRFLFSGTPDFYIDPVLTGSKQGRKKAKEAIDIYQTLVDAVLEENCFGDAILKAAKDCFIGKRIAFMFNINEDTGIQVSFMPSLEFVYDVDPSNSRILTKITAFYGLNDEKTKAAQRIYKKKYWMENGLCHYSEIVYDGHGNVVETYAEKVPTRFAYIPAWVIVNDGLTGDLIGKSEIESLQDYEGWYSRLASADMDAERKGMNPIRYAIDADPNTTKGLSISAGAFWDLATDQNQAQERAAQVGVLDSPMTYSAALDTTLNRIKNMMYEQCAVPNVNPEALQGVVSSGKTLKAIYWDLIVRCDEKMQAWRPALKFMVKCIIEGARLYPKAAQRYLDGQTLPTEPYTIRVENQYSLPEDETEEKTIDLAEVTAQTMSRKRYMKKWHNLTDDEVEEELRQLALERQMLEDSFSDPPTEYNQDEENEPPEDRQEPEKELPEDGEPSAEE